MKNAHESLGMMIRTCKQSDLKIQKKKCELRAQGLSIPHSEFKASWSTHQDLDPVTKAKV